MVGNTPEERKMFRITPMHYVVFDEAHMLKNMNTQRYENLIRIHVSAKETNSRRLTLFCWHGAKNKYPYWLINFLRKKTG